MSIRSPRRIVVGVSGSAASVAALRWAASEASDRRARLDVVRYCETSTSPPPYNGHVPPPAAERRAMASRELASIVREVLGPQPAVEVVAELADGRAERDLADRCADADLLVLGTHARAQSAGQAVGPVLRACISSARCPVVIVAAGDSPVVASNAADQPQRGSVPLAPLRVTQLGHSGQVMVTFGPSQALG